MQNPPTFCIIGAGYSGLTAALQLKRELNLSSFTIFDINPEIGGAWYINTYPGCECDFQIHFYSWSFEPNPDWSKNYCSSQEILDYMKRIATKYEIYKNFCGSTQVNSAIWQDNLQKWRITRKNLISEEIETTDYDFMIVGANLLWQPYIPKEFEAFNRPRFHSARWDHSVDLTDKVVGVIGSGSSAVQILPSIEGIAKEVHSYQRTPSWILPKPSFEFSSLTKWIFRNVPLIQKLYRWSIFWEFERFADVGRIGSNLLRKVTDLSLSVIKTDTKDPKLTEQLTPNYTFGCKVISFSSTYYTCLSSPKVKVHFDPITSVTSNGITTEQGGHNQLDVLILATGFQPQKYFSPLDIFGVDKVDLLKAWIDDRPRCYNGIMPHEAPNLFFLLGPNGTLTTTSAIYSMECEVNFIVILLRHMLKNNYASCQAKQSAVDTFINMVDQKLSQLIVGMEECGSWFLNERGVNTVTFPGTGVDYWRQTRKLDPSQFTFRRRSEF